MACGLLQLAARGIQDLYMTEEPEITFFKTVFRRHSNFSTDFHNVNFAGPLDFGRKTTVKIPKWGDLLHRLFMVIEIPEVDLVYRSVCADEIQKLLAEYGIIWEPDDDDSECPFDQQMYDTVVTIIAERIAQLQRQEEVHHHMASQLGEHGPLHPTEWFSERPSTRDTPEAVRIFTDDMMNHFFYLDPRNIMYRFIDAHMRDVTTKPRQLTHGTALQNSLLDSQIEKITMGNENIQLYVKTAMITPNITTSEDQASIATVLRNGIRQTYGDAPYTHLDAYHMADAVLNTVSMRALSPADVENTRCALLDAMRMGLHRNFDVLSGIYNSLNPNTDQGYKFTFYRKLTRTSAFTNYSRFTSPPTLLNDHFTDKLVMAKDGLAHPYSQFVESAVGDFHMRNEACFRTDKYAAYFADTTLWEPTAESYISKHHYFLNNVWILMNQDIPMAIETHLQGITTLSSDDKATLMSALTTTMESNHKLIYGHINVGDNMAILQQLETSTGSGGMFSAIFRPGAHINQVPVPQFIADTFVQVVNKFDAPAGIKSKLQAIINLFRTPREAIPEYATFVSQNRNICRDPMLQINRGGHRYAYVISSIFYDIFMQFIDNINHLYDDQLLNISECKKHAGSQLANHMEHIHEMFIQKSHYTQSATYGNMLPENGGSIGSFLHQHKTILTKAFQKFDANREKLLTLRNTVLPRTEYYYARTKEVLWTLGQTRGSVAFGAMDICHEVQSLFEAFCTTTVNPFSFKTQPYKYQLWTQHTGTFDGTTEYQKFTHMFAHLFHPNNGSHELHKVTTTIDTTYNGFKTETDVCHFMRDYVVQHSMFKDFPLHAATVTTVRDIPTEETPGLHTRVVNHLHTLCDKTKAELNALAALPLVLLRSLNAGEQARFAWIRKLGHYIIDFIRVRIGDQVIDKHYGEWLEIWHEETKHIKKEPGYRTLIGDIPILTTFDRCEKPAYKLMIPMQFWFNKFPGLSFPLIHLLYSDLSLDIKLRDLDSVSYREGFTRFVRQPKLKCYLMAEYIYLDADERRRLATGRLEYLIDTVQHDVSGTVLAADIRCDGVLERKFYFQNPIMSLYWVLQNENFVNGSMHVINDEKGDPVVVVNGVRKYHVYAYDEDERINPVKAAKLMFDGRDREEFKDIVFYEQVMPFERHHASPSTGINCYSFSLNPEVSIQPMGTANFSELEEAAIVVRMHRDVVKDMMCNCVCLRWGIYGLGYNVLRFASGMAGLMFTQL